MTTDFAQPTTGAVEPKRDRWGRPLIVPLDGGTPIAYTRVSTLAKCIDDTSNLLKWMQRMVATGIGQRPDLATLAAALDPVKDKRKLNELVEQAMASAQSDKSANLGTALHTFGEWADSPGFDIGRVPAEYRTHVTNYLLARQRAKVKALAMERFVVCDELGAAGSFDRLDLYESADHGTLIVIDDLKTGSSATDYPHNITMQVATYAHSVLYDVETGTRTPIPGVSLKIGLLTHWDQATGECRIYELDLVAGWEAARLAADVHAWRKRKGLIKEVAA
jgi:hypothetical protein